MAENVDYFIPPDFGEANMLARWLTPLPANACDAFVHAYAPEGGLVWDPFCRSETIARIVMRQGKRALLSDFNPLIAFIVRSTLHIVSPRQLDRALTALAAAPILQTTLESYINSLYVTTCSVCGAHAIVRSYSWSREQNRPLDKQFHCMTCNQMRNEPVNEADSSVLSRIEERGRAYWTLLERLGASEGPLHPLGERLLHLYTPRSIHTLSAIQSKIEVAINDRETQDVLLLALLDVMERCLKGHVDERDQRQRTTTARLEARAVSAQSATFVETNCWIAFVEACSVQRERLEALAGGSILRSTVKSAPASSERDTPPVVVRQASARRVAATLAEGSVDLIVTAPPTLDWGDMLVLTWLWTGWILGKDEAQRFSAEYLLRPKRPNDWPWFFTAMEKSCCALAVALKPGGKLVFCFPLGSLSYINVLILAATAAGLQLENIAYQPSSSESLRRPPALGAIAGYCYLRFQHASRGQPISDDSDLPDAVRRECVAAAVQVLRERAEAAAYVWLHLAAVLRLSQSGLLARLVSRADDVAVWDRLRAVQAAIEQANGDAIAFVPWAPAPGMAGTDEVSAEETPSLARQRGWWRLADGEEPMQPMSDRAEWAIYTVLSTSSLTTTQAINRVVYALFPGLLTPDPGFVQACVQSYATPASPIHWQLHPRENLALRSEEHTEMLVLLTELGHRLGFRVWIGRPDLRHKQHGARLMDLLSVAERYMTVEDILPDANVHSQLIDVIWYQNRRASHIFEVEWTAMLSESILRRGSRAAGLARFVLIAPERVTLVQLKLDSQPLLRQRVAEDGWRFLRFDLLRDLAQTDAPSASDLVRLSGLQRRKEDEGVQLTLL